MRCNRFLVVLTIAAVAMALVAGTANAAPLISEDFQSPMYPGRTADPSFTGWSWNNAPMVKTARPDYRTDAPGDSTNQSIQFEWTSAEAMYIVTAPTWNAGDFFELTLDVAPQSWNGSLDRYIAPSLTQGSTTWSGSELMAKYGTSPVWEQKQFYIPTTGFTSGSDVTLKIDHTGQRGIYIDNVNLTVDAPPIDNDPPVPDPPLWDTAPTVFDYTSVFMSVNPSSDPSGVEYLFTNTTNTNNSGWQDSTQWVDSGLDQNTNYGFQVIARDKSPNQNPTGAATDSATTGGLDGLIFASGFEYPEYSNNTANPDFVGWVWNNAGSVKSRTNSSDGLPGGSDNQAVQFEYTSAYGTRPTDHGWSADETYTVSLNVAPQQWHGADQRYFEATLLEGDGTVLWESGDVPIPLYDNFGGNPWPAELSFSFDVDGSLFEAVAGAAEGSPLSLRVVQSGQRGIYFDNVMLTFESAAVIPEPSTFALAALGLLGLGFFGRRRRRR